MKQSDALAFLPLIKAWGEGKTIQYRLDATDDDGECPKCGEPVSQPRLRLGYACCLSCGEQKAREKKHTLVPVPKSNYVYAHTAEDVLSPYSHKGNR